MEQRWSGHERDTNQNTEPAAWVVGHPLPSGTVTFLFTDIVGSTPLWESQPEQMADALQIHNAALRKAIEANNGVVFKTVGDAFQAAFPTALDGLKAAIAGQRLLQSAAWNELGELKVRMGLHTGEATLDPGGDEYAVSHTKNRIGRIHAIAHGGQILLSSETWELVDHRLPPGVTLNDLGQHHLKGLLYPEHLFQVNAPGLQPDFPPLASESRPSHNLPLELTQFIGRVQEIAQVQDLLRQHRLVTLTGSGGVGKTRLSIQAAGELLAEFQDGIWYVELAPISDPDLVPQTVISVLGLYNDPSRTPVDILSGFLRTRELLLMLDNGEHLLGAIAQLVDTLLHNAPSLKILISSREALGIRGEYPYRVPSLAIPDPRQLPALDDFINFDAVQLFTERARVSLPTFQVTEHNSRAVAQICQRLDGIPLALELAAARLSLLTAEQLASRLDKAFRLLTGGSRTALPRQQTLRGTIDWSYQLLSESERLLLRRLAVFAGGADLEGIEAVCTGEGLEVDDIFDLLSSLVNKSMVDATRKQGEETRYRLLETVRQYAREKLVDSGDMPASRRQHLAYFTRLAETAEPLLFGSEAELWMRRVQAELENIRLALEVGLDEDPPAGLRLCSALTWFWARKNINNEASRWLVAYLDRPENAPRNATRGRALARYIFIAWFEPVVESLAQESLAISREVGDRLGEGWARLVMGIRAMGHDDYPTALVHLETAQAILEEVQEPFVLTYCYFQLSLWAWYPGDLEKRLASLEKMLALAREKGDWYFILLSLGHLAWVTATDRGDLRRGLALIEEVQALGRQHEVGDFYTEFRLAEIYCWLGEFERAAQVGEAYLEIRRNHPDEGRVLVEHLKVGMHVCWQGRLEEGIAMMEHSLKTLKESSSLNSVVNQQQNLLLELAYANACLGKVDRAQCLLDEYRPLFGDDYYQPRLKKLLGFLALGRDETQEALEYYRAGLRYAQQLGNRLDILLSLEGYAEALGLDGQHAESARLLAAAGEFRAWSGAVIFPRDRPLYDEVVAALKAGLGEADYASAWAEGQALGFDGAIAQVLAAASPESGSG